MKNIKRLLLLVGIFAFTFASCDVDGYDDYGMETSPSNSMNGEWWIDVIDGASGEVIIPHALHKTYDDNSGRMFISDRINYTNDPPISSDFTGWWLVSKVDYNLENLTFSSNNEPNTADDSFVTITEGKILKNASVTESGVVVDSIYFKGEFSYDPGTIIIFAGHKRTGFLEDEY